MGAYEVGDKLEVRINKVLKTANRLGLRDRSYIQMDRDGKNNQKLKESGSSLIRR